MGLSRFSAKMAKIVKKWQSQKILVEKFFLVGIDSECFKTYFKPKISKSKIFSHVKFFSWDSVVFLSKGSNSENWQSQKNLGKTFLVGIDSECFKCILNQKSRSCKFFPCKIFLVGLSRFSAKMTKIVKKWQSQKILVNKSFFGRNRLRMVWNVF